MSDKQKTLQGMVISDKMDKTIVVLVERKVKHPVYGKYVTRSTKIHAHDANNECEIGDIVVIREAKPISRTKRWAFEEIISKSKLDENEKSKLSGKEIKEVSRPEQLKSGESIVEVEG